MKRILIVDDEDDLRDAMASALRADGYAVEEAANGREALSILAVSPEPCLILLDMMMPGMSGDEVLAVLEKSHRMAALPVVVISAADSPRKAPRRFIRKPLTLEVLTKVVREYCQEA